MYITEKLSGLFWSPQGRMQALRDFLAPGGARAPATPPATKPTTTRQ
jgi:hypothetical protein